MSVDGRFDPRAPYAQCSPHEIPLPAGPPLRELVDAVDRELPARDALNLLVDMALA